MTNQTTSGRRGDVVRAWATREGVFIGPEIALIQRNRHRGGQPFEVRPNGVIDAALSRLWGREIELRGHADALNGAMLALNRGDLALAKQIARGIALPPVPESLRKEWEESKHPRHPAGTPEGGEFAPANGEGSGAPSQVADASATQVAAAPKPRQVPPPVSETAPGVDWKFIEREEGFRLDGYVPYDRGIGQASPKSGVTVATGVDLGQRSKNDIDNLDIPQSLRDKLKPYAGLMGRDAADYVFDRPLKLTPEEAAQLNDAVRRETAERLSSAYNTAISNVPGAPPFRDLPKDAQTAAMSYGYQRGTNFGNTAPASGGPAVWDAIVKQDWNRAADEVSRSPVPPSARRQREAALFRRAAAANLR